MTRVLSPQRTKFRRILPCRSQSNGEAPELPGIGQAWHERRWARAERGLEPVSADLVATVLLTTLAQGNAMAVLTLILVVTMFLSYLMNKAGTAAVMCPIALGTASALGINPDSFLMAVAIGASCAFLTRTGHQNNTLILGPARFNFGDFWRPGLPLEILVVAISVPMLLLV